MSARCGLVRARRRAAAQAESNAHRRGRLASKCFELAIAGHEPFEVYSGEIDRGGVSYTVDTLEQLHEELPDARIVLLDGRRFAGRFAQLGASRSASANWRSPPSSAAQAPPNQTIRALARFMPPERLAVAREHRVEMPGIDLSATDIRRRVAAGQSIRYRTPRAVEKYIETHRLYRK